MSFLGDGFRVGDSIPLLHYSVTALNEEAVPTWGPFASIYKNGSTFTHVVNLQLSPIDFMDRPGLYGLLYQLDDSLFTAGKYTIVYESYIGSFYTYSSGCFEVRSGGNADGPVLSMGYWQRPEGIQVLSQLASGKVGTGYGPSVISG